MAISGGVRVEGLTRVVRDLQALGVEVDDLKTAFANIAAKGAELAAGFAPVRTGRLASSVRGNRAKSKAVIRAGGGAVRYAGPINYGWPARGIEASAFMQKADAALEPVVLDELVREINEAIARRGLD